jgi:hypothetical protein
MFTFQTTLTYHLIIYYIRQEHQNINMTHHTLRDYNYDNKPVKKITVS